MSLKMNGFWSTALLVVLAAGLSAQTPAQPPAQPRVRHCDAGETDVPRPGRSRHERHHRARRQRQLRPRPEEGRIRGLRRRREAGHHVDDGGHWRARDQRPRRRRRRRRPKGSSCRRRVRSNDVSGRIFLFFVDDLHLQFHNTGRVRELFKKISKELVHDGDMFGIVSSGPSSIAIDMTYDKTRLDEAIKKIAGSELKPTDIINGPSGAEGPSEVRYRAHVAFSTVNDLLNNLETVHNRRKALVYVSDGYDFNPFQDARLGLMDPNSPFAQNEFAARAESDAAERRRASSNADRSVDAAAEAERDVRRRGSRARARRAHAAGEPRERHDLHDRPARPGRHGRHRRAGRSAAVERVRPQVAGQPARARGRDRRHRRRQPERLRQGAEADRRRDERLLRARVLLEAIPTRRSAAARSK